MEVAIVCLEELCSPACYMPIWLHIYTTLINLRRFLWALQFKDPTHIIWCSLRNTLESLKAIFETLSVEASSAPNDPKWSMILPTFLLHLAFGPSLPSNTCSAYSNGNFLRRHMWFAMNWWNRRCTLSLCVLKLQDVGIVCYLLRNANDLTSFFIFFWHVILTSGSVAILNYEEALRYANKYLDPKYSSLLHCSLAIRLSAAAFLQAQSTNFNITNSNLLLA